MTHTNRLYTHRLLLIAGLVFLVATPGAAQGRVRGFVVDRDGAPIPGATVDAEELEAAGLHDATTDDSGRFSFIGLNRGEWRFVIRAEGFEPVQGLATVQASGPGVNVRFTLDRDPFNPPAPTVGVLAGLTANEILKNLVLAEELFDAGDYDDAIAAYRAVLAAAPAMTSLNLQIGYALHALERPAEALDAYHAALEDDPSNVEAQAAIAAAGGTAQDR